MSARLGSFRSLRGSLSSQTCITTTTMRSGRLNTIFFRYSSTHVAPTPTAPKVFPADPLPVDDTILGPGRYKIYAGFAAAVAIYAFLPNQMTQGYKNWAYSGATEDEMKRLEEQEHKQHH